MKEIIKVLKAKQNAIVVFSSLIGALLALVFNFFVLEKILIPDPCFYHSNETNIVFDIFYFISSSEGGHPVPTSFNIIFTLAIGAVLGLILSNSKRKKINKKQDNCNI